MKAVILSLHGLNLKSEKMNDIHNFFESKDYRIVRSSIDLHEKSKISWSRQFEEDYLKAKSLSEIHQVPLIFLGYSLGSLLAVELALKTQSHGINKFILVSPPITPKALFRFLLKLPLPMSFKIPSWNHKEYRKNSYSKVEDYKEIANILSKIPVSSMLGLQRPTLVLIDPKDELVEAKKLNRFIEENELKTWKIKYITKKSSPWRKNFHHLLIDQKSMGEEAWKEMTQAISEFI